MCGACKGKTFSDQGAQRAPHHAPSRQLDRRSALNISAAAREYSIKFVCTRSRGPSDGLPPRSELILAFVVPITRARQRPSEPDRADAREPPGLRSLQRRARTGREGQNHPGDPPSTRPDARHSSGMLELNVTASLSRRRRRELGPRHASAFEGMMVSARIGTTEIKGPIIGSSHLLGLLELIAELVSAAHSRPRLDAETADADAQAHTATRGSATMKFCSPARGQSGGAGTHSGLRSERASPTATLMNSRSSSRTGAVAQIGRCVRGTRNRRPRHRYRERCELVDR